MKHQMVGVRVLVFGNSLGSGGFSLSIRKLSSFHVSMG